MDGAGGEGAMGRGSEGARRRRGDGTINRDHKDHMNKNQDYKEIDYCKGPVYLMMLTRFRNFAVADSVVLCEVTAGPR